MTEMSRRPLWLYLLFVVVTIFAGLLSRSSLLDLPEFLSLYAGDTLWGLMVFWLMCVLFLQGSTRQVMLFALLFAYAIEFSQFYQADWINELRATRPGGLILGFGFKASDLVCYTVGIVVGAGIDLAIIQKRKQSVG